MFWGKVILAPARQKQFKCKKNTHITAVITLWYYTIWQTQGVFF